MERYSWLRWVRSLRNTKSRTVNRKRDLRLEALEARETPAGITFTWTGQGTDNFWSNPSNWTNSATGAGTAAPTGNADERLVFPTSSQTTSVNDLVGAIFNSITISGSGYNISGQPIQMGDISFGSSGSVTLGAGVTNATLGLNIFYGAGTNSTMPFAIGTGSTLNYTGQLSGTADKGLAKSGLGTLVLQNANPAWDGLININQGILEVGNDESLGSLLGGTVVDTSAQLRIGGNLSISEPITLNGAGVGGQGALLATSGNSQLNGNILLDSNTTLGANPGATLDIRGIIEDAGAGHALVKEGQGTIIFSGANTFRGILFINNGILQANHELALGFTDGTEATGTVVNSTSLQSGTLLLDPGPGESLIIANEVLTLNGGGFQGQGALANETGQNIWTGTVNLGGTSTSPITIRVEDDNTAYDVTPTEDLVSSYLLIGSGAPYGLPGNGILQTPNGLRDWTKTGEGVLVLTSANTYEGRTNINAGTVEIRDSRALGIAGEDDNEIQQVILQGFGGSGGIIQLEYAGFVTDPITVLPATGFGTPSISAGIRTALEALPNIGPGNVQVNRTTNQAGIQIYNVQFIGALAGSNLPEMTIFFQQGGTFAGINTLRNGGTNGTVVNDGATLALRVDKSLDPALVDSVTGTTNTMFVTESVTLNGAGISGLGALRSVAGINTFAGQITLATPASIGVDADPNQLDTKDYFTQEYALTIPGSLNSVGQTLTKTGQGHLKMPTANEFFTGDVEIISGWITIQDEESLGVLPPGVSQNQRPNVSVFPGAALHIKPLNPGESLTIQQNFTIAGQGFEHAYDQISNKGAITSLNGINYLPGNIRLGGEAGIGSVLVDPADFAAGQLHVTGALTQAPPTGGGNFDPAGNNQEFARTFRIGPNGTVSIDVDVYTASDSVRVYYGPRGSADSILVYDSDPNYVGVNPGPFVEPTNQFRVQIDIDFSPDSAIIDVTPLPGKSFGGKGGGGSKLGLNWELQDLGPTVFDYGRTVFADSIELVINEGGSGTKQTQWKAAVTFSGAEALGGLVKLGDQLVVVQGNGSYQGDVNVAEGVLLVQNDTGLGIAPTASPKRVTVQEGATLALGTTIPELTGGRQSGIQAQNFLLELNGTGNNTLLKPNATDRNPDPVGQLAPLEILPNAEIVNGSGSTAYTTIVPSDYLWRGGISLNKSSAIHVPEATRLNVLGGVFDSGNEDPAGSDLIFFGGGELGLFGAGSFRGELYVGTSTTDNPTISGSIGNGVQYEGGVNEHFTGSNTPLPGGTLTVGNSQALGTADGGTIVQEGSVLQLEGNLTIAGEPLTIAGSGLNSVVANPPAIWFQQGPAPLANGPTYTGNTGNFEGTAGRITGIAVDTTDPTGQTIIVATAGGGSWRTLDGGFTWQPTFDNIGNIPMYMGAVAISPTDANVVYLATGEGNNSPDSFAGTGVYRSTDGGKTWESTPLGGVNNPIRGLSVTRMLVDPNAPNMIYVATSDTSPNAQLAADSAVGIWRFNTNNNSWTNLTGIVSQKRRTGDSATDAALPPPNTAGPDDDWRIVFPTANTSYSDILITQEIVGLQTRSVLWMAVGAPDGSGNATGVYYLRNPAGYNDNMMDRANGWVKADTVASFVGQDPATNYNNRDVRVNGIPGPFSDPAITTNGVIRLAGSGVNVFNYPVASPVGGNIVNQTRVFAFVTHNVTKEYLAGFVGTFAFDSNDSPTRARLGWAAVGASPGAYMGGVGHYSSIAYAIGETVIVGGNGGIFLSTNSGGAWTNITSGTDAPAGNPHSIVPYSYTRAGVPANGFLVGTDGGLFFFNAADQSWTNLNGNMANSLIRGVGVVPSNTNQIYAGNQWGGIGQTNGTQTWNSVFSSNAQSFGGIVRVDPNNSDIIYAAVSNGPVSNPGTARVVSWTIYRSTDGGSTWAATPAAGTGLTPTIAVDSVANNRVVYGTNTGVFESLNGLTTGGTFLFSAAANTALAISSFQGNYVFDPAFPNVADKGASSYDGETIYASGGATVTVTKNRGITTVSRPLPGNLGNISGLAVDARNRDTVVAVRNGNDNDGKVYFSTNAGQTWQNITANLEAGGQNRVWSVALDSRNGNLYVGTDRGVFTASRTATGYSTWTRVGGSAGGTSLANVQVREVVLNTAANTLTIGTYGRGVFTLWLNEAEADAGALRVVSGSSIWTGDIFLRGDVKIGVDGSQEFRGVTAASLNILGSIRDEDPLNPGNLVKTGGGTLTLSGANTYAGLTTIEEGVIIANNLQALGTPDEGTIVLEGAALQLINSVAAEPLTLFGNGPTVGFNGHFTGALENLANNNTYGGPITLGSDTTIGVNTGTNLTITGEIGDNGNNFDLVKELTGTLALRPLDGNGDPSVNTYGGDTFVNQGALRVEGDGALGLADSATFVRNGAQLQVGAPAGSEGITINNETLHLSGTGINNSGALVNTVGNNTWAGNIVLDAIPGFAPFSSAPGVSSINVNRPQDTLTITGVISDPTVASGIRKIGAGTLALDAANTYRGTTYVDGGAVRIQDEQALGTTNTNEIQRVVTTGSTGTDRFRLSVTNPLTGVTSTTANINWDATAADVLDALGSLTSVGGIANVQVVKSVITTEVPDPSGGGSMMLTANVFTVTFVGALANVNMPLMARTIPGPEGSGPSAQPASGATADVSVVADGGIGTLVANGAVLELDLADGTVTGEALVLNGSGLGGTGALNNVAGSNTWNGTVHLATSSAVGVADGDLTLAGAVSGGVTSQLTKTGPGTAFLTTANTYEGNTLVQQGILNVSHAQALGAGSSNEVQTITFGGSIATNFSLRFGTGPGNTTPLRLISTSTAASVQADLEALATIGAGNVQVTKSAVGNTYTVTFTGDLAGIDVPQIQVVNLGSGASASVTTTVQGGLGNTTVQNGATLQMSGNTTIASEALFLNGNGVGGIGALDSSAGNNTWSGRLTLNTNSSIGAAAGSTLNLNTGIAQTAANTNLIKVGTGTVNMTGSQANTYNGSTTVADGVLGLDKSVANGAILGPLVVGNGAGTGTLLLLGNEQIADAVNVTVNATGTFRGNDRTETIAGLTINGGAVDVGDDLVNNATVSISSLNMTGGTLNTGETGDQVLLRGTGAVTATAGTSGPAIITGNGTFNLNGAAHVFNVSNAGSGGADLVVESTLTGSGIGGVTKQGNGLMRIDSDNSNTLTNTILLQAGMLQVDGVVGGVQVSGGMVGGNGTVGRMATAGNPGPAGIINPGDLGNLDKEGRLVIEPGALGQTFNANTTLFFDLTNSNANEFLPAPAGAPGGYDQILVKGNVTVAAVQLAGTVGISVVPGDQFVVLTTTDGSQTYGTIEYTPASPNAVFINGVRFNVIKTPTAMILEAVATTTTVNLAVPTTSVYGQAAGFSYTATVTSEAGPGSLPAGSAVLFEVFQGNSPTGTPLFTELVPLNASGQAAYNPQVASGGILGAGTYFVRASFEGTTLIASSTDGRVHTITKSDTNFAMVASNANPVLGEAVEVTVTITPRSPGGQIAGRAVPSGTVTIRVDGTPLATPFTLNSSGQAVISLPDLPLGTRLIDVTYNGDDNYNTVGSTPATRLVINVRKANASLTVTPSAPSALFGQSITFTANVNPIAPATETPTGTVTFRRGTTSGPIVGTAPIVNGSAVLDTSSLPVGSHVIFAIWPGDANYVAPPAASTTVNITRVGTSVDFTSSVNPSLPGQVVALRAQVTADAGNPTGSVRFINTNNGAILGTAALNASGMAVLNFSFPLGTFNLRAEYLGNANLDGSSANLTQVTAYATQTALSSNVNPSQPGQAVTFTATVAKGAGVPAAIAAPTGTVEFYNDSVSTTTPAFTAPLTAAGLATWTTTTLPNGANNIRAVFVPATTTYASTTATLTQNVVFNSTTSVVATNTTIVSGQSNTYTATVSGAFGVATGSVEFRVGSLVLGTAPLDGSGQATFVSSGVIAPATAVTAVYLGDNTYGSSQGQVSLTVNRANTTVGLTSNGPSTGFGTPAVFTATVAAVAPGSGIPTGQVRFTATPNNGGTTRTQLVTVNASGEAVWNVSNLARGGYTVTAEYLQSNGYNGSDSAPISHTILSSVTVGLTSSANPALPTQDIVYTATVTRTTIDGPVEGTVTFLINGVEQPPVNLTLNAGGGIGTATFTLPAGTLPLGSHTVEARFDGNANYGVRVSPTLNQSIRGNTTVAVSSSNASAPAGSPVTLTATLTQVGAPVGSPVPTGTVQFRNGNVVIGTATVVTNGGVSTASITVNNLAPGTRAITAVYSGDSFNNGSTSPVFNQVIIPLVASLQIVPSNATPPVNTLQSMRVTALGPTGSVATSFNGTGSFRVLSFPAGAVVGGPRTTSFANGVGTFSGLTFSRIGTYVLQVTVDGVTRNITFSVTGGGRA
jgi:autotransporter-associated beta strand protein